MESGLSQEKLIEAMHAAIQAVFKPVADLQALREKKALTTAEAAKLYGIGKNTLEQMRMNGEGPEYSQVEKNGAVRYTHEALDAWIGAHRIKTF